MMRFVISCGVSLAVAIAFLAGNGPASAQPMQEKLAKAMPEKAPAVPKQARKLLIFSRTTGYRHSSAIGFGGKALIEMGKKTGAYEAIQTEDPSYFAPEKLKEFDAVLFLNTTGEPLRAADKLEEEYKKSLVDFVKGGKGIIGIHAACDTYHKWPEFAKMMGGEFAGHPWGEIPVKNLEPKNPVNAAFDGKDFDFRDEIYTFKDGTALATERRMLLCVDNAKFTKGGGPKRVDNTHYLSWIANYGKGRNFYCAFGHDDQIFVRPAVLQHYLAGIQFALGDLVADATPSQSAPPAKTEQKPKEK